MRAKIQENHRNKNNVIAREGGGRCSVLDAETDCDPVLHFFFFIRGKRSSAPQRVAGDKLRDKYDRLISRLLRSVGLSI